MRYLMMVVLPAGNEFEKGVMPSAELIAEMTKFNEEMAKAGILLALDGLYPTEKGARVSTQNGQRIVTDGPFAEGREVVGGYWIIKVGSKEEALDWAKRVPDPNVTLELRQIFDMEDFPQELQEAGESPTLREHLETVNAVSGGEA